MRTENPFHRQRRKVTRLIERLLKLLIRWCLCLKHTTDRPDVTPIKKQFKPNHHHPGQPHDSQEDEHLRLG